MGYKWGKLRMLASLNTRGVRLWILGFFYGDQNFFYADHFWKSELGALLKDFDNFARTMCLKYMFADKQKTFAHPFNVKSTWQPPMQKSVALENYLEETYVNILWKRDLYSKYLLLHNNWVWLQENVILPSHLEVLCYNSLNLNICHSSWGYMIHVGHHPNDLFTESLFDLILRYCAIYL